MELRIDSSCEPLTVKEANKVRFQGAESRYARKEEGTCSECGHALGRYTKGSKCNACKEREHHKWETE
jgi:hypothetical protein